jgi:hypothetical protein
MSKARDKLYSEMVRKAPDGKEAKRERNGKVIVAL